MRVLVVVAAMVAAASRSVSGEEAEPAYSSALGDAVATWALQSIVAMSVAERFRLLAGVCRGVGCASCVVVTRMFHARWKTAPADKERIAVHECGHAVAILENEAQGKFEFRGARLSLGHPVVSGATLQRLKRKPNVLEAGDLKRLMVVALAGRAAEHELLGQPTLGAAADLAVARRLAMLHVELFGLDDKTKPEVLVKKAYAEARALARRRKPAINRLAASLCLHDRVSPRLARKLLTTDAALPAIPPPNAIRELCKLIQAISSTTAFFSLLAHVFELAADKAAADRSRPPPPRRRFPALFARSSAKSPSS